MTKSRYLIYLILILAFILRLYRIDSPVADWHSFRQADTAAVARNFLKFGFDPLRPRYDDLSNIASGKDNPLGWRMVEFPLYQLVGAGLAKIFGLFSLEVWLRLITILASVGSVYFLYRLGQSFVNVQFGLISAFLFAALPYLVYYGRVILPEPIAVFFALGSIFFFVKINHRPNVCFYSLSLVFAALSLLVKPTAGFVLLPLAYIAWRKYGFAKLVKSPWAYLYILGVFTPLVFWRYWIQQFPEGIPVYTWLLNSDGIRFKGAWFYWLFGERIAKLILGYWGVSLLPLGLIANKTQKEGWFFFWLGAGAVLYLSIFATGNVKHDYYQIVIMPAIVFFVARGIEFILNNIDKFSSKFMVFMSLCFIVLMTLALSWHETREFYKVNNPVIVEAGQVVDRLLPADAKVIAPYFGDTAFLYQTNRQGWPLGYDIEDKTAKGATHYVSVKLDDPEVSELREKYKVLKETEDYIILDLHLNNGTMEQ